ncbi:hypothetical protein GCM10010193_35580 [Kitasatospora atroaurantiaca]|uniref:Ig-like domain-containing protein n=1 Tax=Kitasatospora atroaurantiaca TaxID=285545 RepID=A0A561ETF5_9ACTN|nr:hypothetical protein [Kitasatospora atroaurantiaca]TWE18896.1 hypothetical protein FB465_3992 [Kitasatospora atroaurantiaca]
MDRAYALVPASHRLGRLALAGVAALTLAAAATPATAATPVPAPHADAPVPPPAQSGKFVQTPLTRILDTRSAIGVPGDTQVPSGTSIKVATKLPADAKAVVMNVTVTKPTSSGYLTVYPDGAQRPTTSNLNFTAGQTIPNSVTVPVTNGYVDFYNFGGSADVIADLAGYYTDDAATTGSSYVPVAPGRVLDTRKPIGTPTVAPVGGGKTLNLKLAGTQGIPAQGATAVVLNVTATGATAGSYLTVFPHGTERPTTSNLNFGPNQTIPNLVTVPLGEDGSVDIYNLSGNVDVVADIFGYYQSAPTGAGFTPTGPKRMIDTRADGNHPIGPGATLNLSTALGGLGTTKVSAVVLNVTATRATAGGYLTVFPGNGTGRPTTSNLNFTAGQTIPNLVVVPVDDSGLINIYNFAGSTDVIVDLFGYFTDPAGGPTDLKFGTGTSQYGQCGAPAPGPWQPVSEGDSATVGAMPGPFQGSAQQPSDIQVRFVVTDPAGNISNYSATSGFGANKSVWLAKPVSGAYSWYAYATDGKTSSAPSKPCFFQVDGDSRITGVTVTSNGVEGQIFQGMPLTFTFTATSTGSTDGKNISGFCYAMNQAPSVGCSQIPAVNGKATVNLTTGQWGSQALYVQAFTASGWTGAPTIFTYYVRWQ